MSTVLASDAARPGPPEALIADLNPAQREAVLATSGPVAILAGAGTGKTRVISRRTAVAIATGVVPADQVLVVTFTEKAAGEMVDRLRRLGLPGVTARTFHAHALSQLRHFWPSRHDGAPLPELLDTKLPILGRLARQLPGHYRFTPSRDLATEIEWAKSRRIAPGAYLRTIGDRTPPIPADLMSRIYADYERVKTRSGRMDFDDLLADTIDLLETDAEAAATIRARKRWFSVDEYQDTNPLQAALLEAWRGARRDIAVVGDEDQTIYSFTGASSDYLIGFASRYPDARLVTLETNFRSTPEVLGLANRVLAAGRLAPDERPPGSSPRPAKRLVPSLPAGPAPSISGFATDEAELAAIVAAVRSLGRSGVAHARMAVLVRTNAQLPPIERAFGAAGIGFHVRGEGFFARPEVRRAIAIVRSLSRGTHAAPLPEVVAAAFERQLDVRRDRPPGDGPAAERHAAVVTLLELADELTREDPGATAFTFLTELDRRAAVEAGGTPTGVELLTYHRAKGLEWDAVFLPALEEGTLPIRQATEPTELAEERRLLYVGITRARRHLWLSWATRRVGANGKEARRSRSRFLDGLVPASSARLTSLAAVGPASPNGQVPRTRLDPSERSPLSNALRAWRTARAKQDEISAFIVFHDSTIEAIAAARPKSIAELRRVPGVGPTKLDRYGEEVIGVVVREG